jgi:hypothetical protein
MLPRDHVVIPELLQYPKNETSGYGGHRVVSKPDTPSCGSNSETEKSHFVQQMKKKYIGYRMDRNQTYSHEARKDSEQRSVLHACGRRVGYELRLLETYQYQYSISTGLK